MEDAKTTAWRAYQEERKHIVGPEVGFLPFPPFDTREEYNAITPDQFVNLARLGNQLRLAEASAVETHFQTLCRAFFFEDQGFHRMEVLYSTNWCTQATCFFQYAMGMGRCVFLAMHLDVERKQRKTLAEQLDAARAQTKAVEAGMKTELQAARDSAEKTKAAAIKALESKVADAWATVRALRVQKEQAHADHTKCKKELETQISELEARVTGSADSARVEALKADLAAARAEVAAAVAALDELKAERRELVLDINAMGEEVDAHFKALQREEDRAIAAESRAAEAESRAAEAESRAAEAESRAAEAESTRHGGRKRRATEPAEPTRRGARKRVAPDRYGA